MKIEIPITEPNQRAEGISDLIRGIGLVNRLLGLSIPVYHIIRADPMQLVQERYADAEAYFSALASLVCGFSCSDDVDLRSLVMGYSEFVQKGGDVTRLRRTIFQLHSLSNSELLDQARRRFSIEELDLCSPPQWKQFVSIKINHAYWEHVAFEALREAGLPYFRDFSCYPLFIEDGFNDLLTAALSRHQAATTARGYAPGCYCVPGFSLGLSFGAGDCPTMSDDLVLPLGSIQKGAVFGSLSFLCSVSEADRYVLSDGSSAKQIILKQQLDAFCSRIRLSSDAIIFIVPRHLQSIRLRDWDGHTTTLLVPDRHVYQLWPAVLPYLIAQLATIIQRFSRVTILVQAGAMSAPLGIALDFLRREIPPEAEVRYFDMGQALDVAATGADVTGPWIQRQDIAGLLPQPSAIPFVLGTTKI